MLLSEKFLLMLLDEYKGKRYSAVQATKDLGLAGAMILDLYFKGKLAIYRKRLRILDYNTCGDPYLDMILVFLNSSKKPQKLKRWVEKLSRFFKQYYTSFFRRLENNGFLISEIKTILRIFKAQRFYLAKPEVKQSLLEQIKNVLIYDMNPGIELLSLLSLMKACRLIKVYFIRKYRKYVKRRIKELLHSSYYAPETREMILSVIKAIEDIIISRSTAAVAPF
ncbi:MAG: hypothetical protein CEE43_10850 [Promethearchaeota archaeon Loki_b32]|nr:MAG: hypothetical protein CEE43_10850 [Candidatus Lokiarchaeota archaeon Loki_b32]